MATPMKTINQYSICCFRRFMRSNKKRVTTQLLSLRWLLGFGFAIVITLCFSDLAVADPPPHLSGRPTPPPAITETPSPSTPPTPIENPPVGRTNSVGKRGIATLVLYVISDENEKLWSVVQWQDALGNWHDVSGWIGKVVNGRTIWWVEEKDFGTGPFRWVVYQQNLDTLFAASESFYLPNSAKQLLVVTAFTSNVDSIY